MEGSQTITIDRPAAEVWPLVGDFRQWSTWVRDISDVEFDSEPAVGTALEYKYRGRSARAAIERYENGRVLGIGAEEKSWTFSESVTLDPQGDRTEVTFRMGFEPIAGWAKAVAVLLVPFKGPLLNKPLRRELQALKAAVESAG